MDSTFIWSSGRLLPVSITETPSIMMLVSPPPPVRTALATVPLTPGASRASAMKLRLAVGRFSTASVEIVNERSPLVAWMMGVSPLTSIDFGRAADLDRQGAEARAVARTHRESRPLQRLECRHRDFNRVHVRGDVHEQEVADFVGDDRRRLRAFGFADERDGRAGNDRRLCVFHRSGHRAGRNLRSHRERRRETHDKRDPSNLREPAAIMESSS